MPTYTENSIKECYNFCFQYLHIFKEVKWKKNAVFFYLTTYLPFFLLFLHSSISKFLLVSFLFSWKNFIWYSFRTSLLNKIIHFLSYENFYIFPPGGYFPWIKNFLLTTFFFQHLQDLLLLFPSFHGFWREIN